MESTFKLVKSAIIHVLKNISIFTNQHNAIMEISVLEDSLHKNQSIRQKLMFICFSPLSSWVLFTAFLLMYLNPWRYSLSISQINFLNDLVTHYFFSNDGQFILMMAFVLFLMSFFMKAEFVLIGLLGFLISNGDIHLRNALLFIPLVILGRLMSHLKLIRWLQFETKKTWSIICALLFLAWLIATGLTLNSFQFLSDQGVFSGSMHFLRFEVFVASVFAYYFIEFSILSIWGHFYCLKIRP